MGLADFVEGTRDSGRRCSAASCIDWIAEHEPSLHQEYLEWEASSGDRMTYQEMAIALSAATPGGYRTSEKVISRHLRRRCVCVVG